MLVLAYPKDIDKKIIPKSELSVIKIEEIFTMLNKFSINGNHLFSGHSLPYTCYVNGVYPNNLIPQTNSWFYHDGKQVNYIKGQKPLAH